MIKPVVKFVLLFAAVAFVASAEEAKEQERPKTFRRLIPADVLRGEYLSTRSVKSDFMAAVCSMEITVSREPKTERDHGPDREEHYYYENYEIRTLIAI